MSEKKPAKPCPRCMRSGFMRREAVQPLPEGALASMAPDGSRQCPDCQSAETVMRLYGVTWEQARTAVANDRQEQYRLPGAPMGLVQAGLVRPSKPGDHEKHMEWLETVFPGAEGGWMEPVEPLGEYDGF